MVEKEEQQGQKRATDQSSTDNKERTVQLRDGEENKNPKRPEKIIKGRDYNAENPEHGFYG